MGYDMGYILQPEMGIYTRRVAKVRTACWVLMKVSVERRGNGMADVDICGLWRFFRGPFMTLEMCIYNMYKSLHI